MWNYQKNALARFLRDREDLLSHIVFKEGEFSISLSSRGISGGEMVMLETAMAFLEGRNLDISELLRLDKGRQGAFISALPIYFQWKEPDTEPSAAFNAWLLKWFPGGI